MSVEGGMFSGGGECEAQLGLERSEHLSYKELSEKLKDFSERDEVLTYVVLADFLKARGSEGWPSVFDAAVDVVLMELKEGDDPSDPIDAIRELIGHIEKGDEFSEEVVDEFKELKGRAGAFVEKMKRGGEI